MNEQYRLLNELTSTYQRACVLYRFVRRTEQEQESDALAQPHIVLLRQQSIERAKALLQKARAHLGELRLRIGEIGRPDGLLDLSQLTPKQRAIVDALIAEKVQQVRAEGLVLSAEPL